MERLTQRCNCGICGSNGNVLLYPLYRIGGDEYMDHGLINQCFEKLAKYEDLEEQGLLFRLPCKVGDIVYYEHPYSSVHTGIQAYQITNIMISQNKKGVWTKKYRAMMLLNGKIIDSQINFSFDDIGKTVFLTREEAEAALEKMKGEEHE